MKGLNEIGKQLKHIKWILLIWITGSLLLWLLGY